MLQFCIDMIIKVFLIVAIITSILLIIDAIASYKMIKRVSKYSINNKSIDSSIVDKIIYYYHNFIIKQRKNIKKMFPRLLNYYKKYTQGEQDEACDLITNKLLLGMTIIILYLFASGIRHTHINLFDIICLFIIGFNCVDIFLYIKGKGNNKKMEKDMLEAIIIMNNAFKAGNSTIQAVEIASEKLTGPLKQEFKKIYKEMQYGLTIDVVFDRFNKRVNVDSATYVSTSLITLNKTGGNIVKVFNSIEKTLFDRKKMYEELKSTTTTSNLVVKILTVVPFALTLFIYILSPNYFDPLLNSTLGNIILVIIIITFAIYLFILNKIMKVDY